MAASRTRPGNPDRGWNDPPMFSFETTPQTATPIRRHLNKRVAFPSTGVAGPTPGHAVLNPNQGPPILNPVLPADLQGLTIIATRPPIPIGLRDTPLGNQAAPNSPIQLLPPTVDTSTPQTVPVLVPLLVPSSPPKSEEQIAETVHQPVERLEELMTRLSFQDDTLLLQHDLDNFHKVLDRYRNILTMKVCDEIQKKLGVFEEKWRKNLLSNEVKAKISHLSIALLSEETDKANHLHLALMVDHIAEVSQWMMGVKRLLQQQQLANKEREIIAENQQENVLQNIDLSGTSDVHEENLKESGNESQEVVEKDSGSEEAPVKDSVSEDSLQVEAYAFVKTGEYIFEEKSEEVKDTDKSLKEEINEKICDKNEPDFDMDNSDSVAADNLSKSLPKDPCS